MRARTELLLDAPVDPLFAILADPRRRPEWQSSLRRVELLTEGPPRVGTRWREWPLGLGAVELEIVCFEEGRAWAERGATSLGPFMIELRFAPASRAQTRLEVDIELGLSGIATALAPAVKAILPRALRSDLRRAARLVHERHAR